MTEVQYAAFTCNKSVKRIPSKEKLKLSFRIAPDWVFSLIIFGKIARREGVVVEGRATEVLVKLAPGRSRPLQSCTMHIAIFKKICCCCCLNRTEQRNTEVQMKLSWKEFSNSLRVHASIKFFDKNVVNQFGFQEQLFMVATHVGFWTTRHPN